MIADVSRRLDSGAADFLLSIHDGKPDFELIDLPAAAALPPIRWKLLNLDRPQEKNPDKHAAQRGQLEKALQNTGK
jgi:hypothetical protein